MQHPPWTRGHNGRTAHARFEMVQPDPPAHRQPVGGRIQERDCLINSDFACGDEVSGYLAMLGCGGRGGGKNHRGIYRLEPR
ncbi:MAG: hypothetical protein WCI95_11550, partial [bacterium]